MAYMPYVFRLVVLGAALLLPLGASAATLSVKNIDNEELSVRYSELAPGVLEVRSASGVVLNSGSIKKSTGRKTVSLPENIPQGTYSLVAIKRDGTELARTTFVVKYDAPTCSASMSKKTAEIRDFVSLRWSSENADKVYVFGKSSKESGVVSIALYHPGVHQYVVNMIGKGGIGSCKAKVLVK